MNKNLKQFLTKIAILVAVIYFTRVIFQFPIEYFSLKLFQQTDASRVFSKIDGLKIATLVALFFGLYFKDRISKIKHPKFNFKKGLTNLLIAEILVAAYYGLRYLTNIFNINSGFSLQILQILVLIDLLLSAWFFSLSIFSYDYIKEFYSNFRTELAYTAGISVMLYNILIFFQNQWELFSGVVAWILYWTLSLFYPIVYHIGDTPILSIGDFAVSIGAPCSGIDSMLLFVAFFAALFALDYKRIRKGRYILFFILGFIGVYIVNILRLFLLMLAGIHISPRFAVGMFHTNAGWVLFLLYFLGYFWLIRKFIYLKRFRGKI